MSYFRDIEVLIGGRRKIEAIKELRARTGLGLKDSKDAVEHFEAHGQWPPALRHTAGAEDEDEVAPTLAHDPGPTPPALREIEQHVARGSLILAIKELREVTSWGLKDSKDAVDEYRAHGAWSARVLAAFGAGSPATPGPVAPAAATAAAAPLAVHQVLAAYLGYAPDFQLTARARRSGCDGHLVMLRDRACFLQDDHGRCEVSSVISYGAVSRTELESGVCTTLYVSVGDLHHRFEMAAADAEAALALLRVFAG